MKIAVLTFPTILTKILLLCVSLKRISFFLDAEELEEERDNSTEEAEERVCGEDIVEIKGGWFGWSGRQENFVLRDVNVKFGRHTLTTIVGKIGSGKTTLLNSMLGEAVRRRGSVRVSGEVSYVPQQCWLRNNTVRENILFGSELMPSKYKRVLNICALEEDLKTFVNGDEMEIGENGVNLSGGQKQRISIARCLYKNADVYIFDDPLFAVDSKVKEYVRDKIFGPEGFLRNKCRILVTNDYDDLRNSDSFILVQDKEVLASRSLDDLYQSGLQNQMEHLIKKKPDSSVSHTIKKDEDKGRNANVKDHTDANMNEEKVRTKIIKWESYLQYIKAIGMGRSLIIALSYAAIPAVFAVSNVVLARWADDKTASLNKEYFIYFSAIGFGGVACEAVKTGLFWFSSAEAAKVLHEKLLWGVMRSPMKFFDRNPPGRILNRFSSDVDIVDSSIPTLLNDVLSCFSEVLVIVVVTCYSNTILIAVFVPLVWLYLVIERLYITTSRQLRRIESIARSPIFTHFNEAIGGAPVIRAFRRQAKFIEELLVKVSEHTRAYYFGKIGVRWLNWRMEVVACFVVFFAALVSAATRGKISPGFVGLLLTYSIMFSDMLARSVMMMSELETNFVALERLDEYIQAAPEDEWEREGQSVRSESWLSSGKIEFKNYSSKYREDLPPVLKEVSVTILGGEKIGVCGRTGAGKTSLTLAIFRLIEPVEGQIAIDGIDVKTLGLHDLRRSLTVIPQDPILFTGTIRFNLDPSSRHEDQEVWSALEGAHLKTTLLEGSDKGLGYEVEENGANLSVGQRQLVCLARALLRNSKILVLDEATAAVDSNTDSLIQATIRREFAKCTVITIAHRLNTIMGSDRVLVLNQGCVTEFDEPEKLLEREGTIFRDLCQSAGLIHPTDCINQIK